MAKAKILIIDDEESPRESLRFILKDRYDLTLRETGTRGLEALRTEGPYAAVLLDMKMPDMTGLEVLGQVPEIAPGTPVVMITAITEAKPAVQAMKMGAADYLNKPFDVQEIRLVVERVILAAPDQANRSESDISKKSSARIHRICKSNYSRVI